MPPAGNNVPDPSGDLSTALNDLTLTSPTEKLIAPPELSDLLTDYNTAKNINIPPPLWARLDNDYREMMGLPAAPELKRVEAAPGLATTSTTTSTQKEENENGGGVILKADGTPLRRVPQIRANQIYPTDIDDDEEEDEEAHQALVVAVHKSIAELKAKAASRRAKKPSPMAIATDEAKARVAAAREARSAQLAKIEEWDKAMDELNRQRDEEVLRVMDEQKRISEGGGRPKVDLMLEYQKLQERNRNANQISKIDDEEKLESRFVEVSEEEETEIGVAL